jgi:hypothetical protein
VDGVVSVVAGALAVALGPAGPSGRMDRTRFRLHQSAAGSTVTPAQHRRLQRLGGAVLVVVGVVFLVTGLG